MMRTEQKQAATLEQTVELLHEIIEQQTELGKRLGQIEVRQEQLRKAFAALSAQVGSLEERWRGDSRALSDVLQQVQESGRKLDTVDLIQRRIFNEVFQRHQVEVEPPLDDDTTDPAIRTPGTRDTIPSGPMGGEE